MYRTVSGYSLEDGSRKWSLRLPADVCAAPTRPTADGKIVIGLLTDTSADAEEHSASSSRPVVPRPGLHRHVGRQGGAVTTSRAVTATCAGTCSWRSRRAGRIGGHGRASGEPDRVK
ncbi:hypothetical protein SBADM41S_01093 [Streptomyces badius]